MAYRENPYAHTKVFSFSVTISVMSSKLLLCYNKHYQSLFLPYLIYVKGCMNVSIIYNNFMLTSA